MKTTLKASLLVLLAVSLNAELKAQGVKIPQASSGQTITQDFGLGKITISYSRPNVKGRKIFGGLELYGNVWRTGATALQQLNLQMMLLLKVNRFLLAIMNFSPFLVRMSGR